MIDNQNFQMSMYCAGSSYEDGIIEYDLFYEEFGFQYFTANFKPDGYDCLRDKFIGNYRTEDNPEAVEREYVLVPKSLEITTVPPCRKILY